MTAVSQSPTLVLPPDVRNDVIEHAHEGVPEEICGVLGGAFDEERSHVRKSYPATNVADRPRTRYEIDPEEAFEIYERIEDRGDDIVGFYHSHPNGPSRPSETDVGGAAWPDRSYLIVSLAREPSVRSWRWRGEEFEEERVVIEQ